MPCSGTWLSAWIFLVPGALRVDCLYSSHFVLFVSLSPLCNWKKQLQISHFTNRLHMYCIYIHIIYIYIYISFHIRLRGVLWLHNWKSCCQEHRQFGSVRIYHLAGFCAWPLWHQWLGTRNPDPFNHLEIRRFLSQKVFFQKTAEAGLACATRLRVSWVTWR